MKDMETLKFGTSFFYTMLKTSKIQQGVRLSITSLNDISKYEPVLITVSHQFKTRNHITRARNICTINFVMKTKLLQLIVCFVVSLPEIFRHTFVQQFK